MTVYECIWRTAQVTVDAECPKTARSKAQERFQAGTREFVRLAEVAAKALQPQGNAPSGRLI